MQERLTEYTESAEPKTPKGEHAWVGYYNKTGSLLFIITSKNSSRDLYYLYRNAGGTFEKIGKGKDPIELCEKHRVYEKMNE